MSIESVIPSSHLILCCPLLLVPSISPSVRVFYSESTLLMRSPKYWSFSFSISPSNEYPGLISFRMDWLDLLAVQGTLKSLLQHHSLKASTLWPSAFFTIQLSHPYTTTGKTITLTRQTFVGKVTSLFFNMLSRLAITLLIFQMDLTLMLLYFSILHELSQSFFFFFSSQSFLGKLFSEVWMHLSTTFIWTFKIFVSISPVGLNLISILTNFNFSSEACLRGEVWVLKTQGF